MYRRVLRLLFGFLFSAGLAYGQGLGSVAGTVTDPSGSVVPAAKVTAREIGTGFERSAKTGPDGYYVINSLRPSNYTVTVEAPGFRTLEQTGITLLADQALTLNMRLTVGVTTQNVTVTAPAQQVDTYTPTLKSVVDEARMVELPLDGRNAAELTLLVAGAVENPSSSASTSKTFPTSVAISTNGARENQTGYMLDGGNNVDIYTNENQPFPFPDSLQEFSVQTSNYLAEYGQTAGGVVNIVTKSGTNQLHGDAFGFVRNAVFNARNFFEDKRDQLKRSQFGATIGGPVIRDKTFFFAGYQGTRIRNIQGGQSAFVPTTVNVTKGDFSALLNPNDPNNPVGQAIQIIDPNTGSPFSRNMIPTARFDSAALNIQSHLPQTGGNGLVFFSQPIVQNLDEFVGRIDHSISSSDRITGRYFADRSSRKAVFDPSNLLTYANGRRILSQNLLFSENHTFRPNLLNEFRFTYSRIHFERGPAANVFNLGDLGVKIFQPPAKALEPFTVDGFFSFGENPPARFDRNHYTLNDDLRWVRGRHNAAFGAQIERARFDINNRFLQDGQFEFTGQSTGYALADLLLGLPRSLHQGNGEFINNRDLFLGFYAQDTVHATSKLTLDYGLRWEPFFPWHENEGRVERFLPSAYFAGQTSQVFKNAPPGLFFPGDPGFPRDGTHHNLNNFAPRVGFAYDLFGDGKMSIRGGVGVFFNTRQVAVVNDNVADASPFSTQLALTPPPGPLSNPLIGIPNPFPSTFPPPPNAVFPAPVIVFVTYDPATRKYLVPTMYNWNLTAERQLAPGWLLRLAYVGSHGSHLQETEDLNPSVFIPNSTLSTDQRRLFKGYSDIFVGSQAVNSSYHSFQATLEKRFTGGLTVQASYTWSRSIDNLPFGGGVVDIGADSAPAIPWYLPNYHGLDRGPSDFDHTHRFVASYVYQLPRLANAAKYKRGVLGNWELSGILTAQTGDPVTIVAGQDQSGTALGGDRGNLVGAAYGPGACGSSAPCVDYLNPASFALPSSGTFGTLGKGSIRGPNLISWNMGFFKDFPVTEKLRLQFRAEFFNIFNRVNFNDPNNTISGGGFGALTGAGDPRIGQLALKVIF